jgi:formate-dependent nitrite reductase membrane component NrfD
VPRGVPDPKQLGLYLTLGQIGMEMVAPLVIGLILDDQLGWTPWATVCGAAFGLVGGLAHLILILILNRQNPRDKP